MARYILIDNYSGYIWGDSADLGGKIFTGTPVEYAQALDESLGEYGRTYTEVARRALALNATGYHVYRADIDGIETVPVVEDGQDQETIEAVERDCRYVTTIQIGDGDDNG
jgi:hypothetical protein